MEHVVALYIREGRVCTTLEKEVNNVEVAFLSSPHGGRGNRFAASCIDVGSRLDQEFAQREVIIYCCPLILESA